ncbi:MAG: hypothetical protein ABIP48_01475 [Planctomycetota bacterium]
MKGKLFLGALLVSAVLCSQGLSATILGTVLGQNCGGCGGCNACAEPACCEPESCEPESCEPACSAPSCGRQCDLFAGLRGLFACQKCNGGGCNTCCGEVEYYEPEVASCVPEPECCEPEACAPPSCQPRCRRTGDLFTGLQGLLACRSCNGGGCGACCEPEACEPACCEPACGNRCGGRSILGFLDNLLGCRKSCGQTACCEPVCCEPVCRRPLFNRCRKSRCSQPSCCGEAGFSGCGGDGAPAAAPAEVQVEEAAPLPAPPQADPSASLMRSMGIYQVSSY